MEACNIRLPFPNKPLRFDQCLIPDPEFLIGLLQQLLRFAEALLQSVRIRHAFLVTLPQIDRYRLLLHHDLHCLRG